MIVRCKRYIKLKEEMKKPDKKPNYITVSAAIKELEKIEMVRQLDNIYCLDHAVTANQKVILKAFGLNANSIKYFASELSKELKKAEADVIAAKKKYDQATANLKELLDKRDAISLCFFNLFFQCFLTCFSCSCHLYFPSYSAFFSSLLSSDAKYFILFASSPKAFNIAF